MYCLTVPEARTLRSRHPVAWPPSEAMRMNLSMRFHLSFQWLACNLCPFLSSRSFSPSLPLSLNGILSQCLPVSTFPFYEDTCHVGWGPTLLQYNFILTYMMTLFLIKVVFWGPETQDCSIWIFLGQFKPQTSRNSCFFLTLCNIIYMSSLPKNLLRFLLLLMCEYSLYMSCYAASEAETASYPALFFFQLMSRTLFLLRGKTTLGYVFHL